VKPATSIRGPWPGNPNELEIVDVPYSKRQTAYNKGKSKYDPVFSKLPVGKAIRCPGPHRTKIALALTKWLKQRGKYDKLRAAYSLGPDGRGYVHLIQREAKE